MSRCSALVRGICGAVLLLSATKVEAVDSSRMSTQARTAPEWANSSTNAYRDPAYNYNSPSIDPSRDRTRTDSIQPQWSDPTQPSFDPRLARPLDPTFGPSNYSQTAQRWRLGIYPVDSDTGVTIREVVRGSAAERAGLEVNDRIVAVHGYQVGYVNGVLYDVGQEFERHADANGWVRVLVQDNRNGQLVNLPVKLDPRNEALTGTITYRDRSNLPRDAVATVELREIIRAGTRPITLARQTITGIQTVPIPFSLDYDPTQIDTRRNYVLHASIEAGGREIYATQNSVSVLDGRGNSNIQLLVQATSLPGGNFPTRNDQIAQITTWFRQYLGREPRSQELYVWEAHLGRGGTLSDAQLQILSTPEFYYQSHANPTEYVRRMFEMVTNRQPSSQEVAQWVNRLDYYGQMRSELAKEFLSSVATAQTRQPGRL